MVTSDILNNIIDNSPWRNYLHDIYNQVDKPCLYYEHLDVIHPADKPVVDAYNKRRKSDCQFNRHLLAVPFQGNPLSAKVVFLTLNPGYIERINRDAAQMLDAENIGCTRFSLRIHEYWSACYDHLASSIFPSKKENRDVYTAFQILGDWYWYDMFAPLRKDCYLDDDTFAEKVAIMQLIPYHSVRCKDKTLDLPTQQYSKQLILYMLEQPDCPQFVVMRSEEKWAELLGIDFRDSKYKDKFILRKTDKNDNPPRKQFISEKAFAQPDDYAKIVNAIKADL